ncbi:MAG: DUF6600 domain-containing protein [Pseudomonadota bacterium]
MTPIHRLISRGLAFLLPALFLLLASASAMAQSDPPGRVAGLSWREGSVVFAPEGENEWIDLPVNRPLTRGDRVWTDRGARAELQLGSATLHVAGQSHLAFYELDDEVLQLSMTQGVLNARVRDLAPRENFEIDTPNLAARALQPGDWRVDVDAANGVTRVVVHSGRVAVYGERGESVTLAGGQQMAFTGRALEQAGGAFPGRDAFDSWAAERNRQEDQSVSARYVPREVIGYSQLDNHGSWGQDPGYGAVWYPRVTVADWAPYRYGHWSWIQPWGWTWVDDAPWGFAPFHYGRWALIGSRWAWVPGRIGPRPVYAPALVVFVGGAAGSDWRLRLNSGPGIAWYPLGPGEAWHPTYRTSTVYISNVNRNIGPQRDGRPDHQFRHRAEAITAVPVNDFNRGRPVREHWQRVQPAQIANAPVVNSVGALPPRPERIAPERREAPPRLQQTPPPAAALPAAPSRGFAPPGLARPMPVTPGRPEEARNPRGEQEQRGQREQQERAQREQEQRQQRDAGVRQQQERQQQERAQQERAQQEKIQQDRAQQERVQREQERQQRDAAARQQQERAAREQERAQHEQERQQRQQQRAVPPPQAAPQAAERPARPAARPPEEARPQPQQRPQRPQRDDDDGKRGQGRGRSDN